MTQDPKNRQFTFNGDNKQTQVKDVNNQIIGQYLYDGSGKRIKKVTTSETTIFVYSGSKLIAEYSTQLATNPTTSYTVTDMLGSPRVITDANGQVVSRRDFMAFGEDIANNVGGRTTANKYGQTDSVRQRFTGYQKDDETGLDFAEARYYNDAHGRFTAVDPLLASGKSVNPQTFNRYVYSMNRPLILIDPTGLQAGGSTKQTRQQRVFAIEHPLIAGEIGEPTRLGTNISSVATRFANNSDFSNKNGLQEVTEINALRHTILSAIITARFGKDIAKEATDAHEDSPDLPSSKQNGSLTFSSEDTADQEADLRNNEVGREIGGNLEGSSNKDIAKAVLNRFKEVGLNVLRVNKDGTFTVINTKIGQTQVNNTLKNYDNRENDTGLSPDGRKELDEERRKEIEKNLRKSARTAE